MFFQVVDIAPLTFAPSRVLLTKAGKTPDLGGYTLFVEHHSQRQIRFLDYPFNQSRNRALAGAALIDPPFYRVLAHPSEVRMPKAGCLLEAVAEQPAQRAFCQVVHGFSR